MPDFTKRQVMAGGVSAILLTAAGAQAQDRRVGPDAGGADAYPGGYLVKAPPTPNGPPVIVTTRLGRLKGVRSGGIQYFRGIPYAQPPVGALRFKPAKPVSAWRGIKEATSNPAAAMQATDVLEAPAMSEDCLYLNIWAPDRPGPHPVYFYIHGGANTAGYSLEHRVNGASFARDGIVCVTVNYRVGLLGFLELANLLGPEYAGSGNNALRDLLVALGWVQENIAAFGGDPSKVTIGGQSAGAFNVFSLMASPRARGLFRGAISQSGGDHTVTRQQALATADEFGRVLKAQGYTPDQLPSLPAGVIIDLQRKLSTGGDMASVVDGDILPVTPTAALRAGEKSTLPLLLGWNRDEPAVLGGVKPLEQLPPLAREGFKRYVELRGAEALSQKSSAYQSGLQFGGSTIVCAANHAAAGGRSYLYSWTWSPRTGRFAGAAFHGIEQSFVWDRVQALAARYVVPEPDFQDRASKVHRLWVEFIRHGRPTAPGVAEWPAYSNAKPIYLDIGEDVQPRPLDPNEVLLWASLLGR